MDRALPLDRETGPRKNESALGGHVFFSYPATKTTTGPLNPDRYRDKKNFKSKMWTTCFYYPKETNWFPAKIEELQFWIELLESNSYDVSISVCDTKEEDGGFILQEELDHAPNVLATKLINIYHEVDFKSQTILIEAFGNLFERLHQELEEHYPDAFEMFYPAIMYLEIGCVQRYVETDDDYEYRRLSSFSLTLAGDSAPDDELWMQQYSSLPSFVELRKKVTNRFPNLSWENLDDWHQSFDIT